MTIAELSFSQNRHWLIVAFPGLLAVLCDVELPKKKKKMKKKMKMMKKMMKMKMLD